MNTGTKFRAILAAVVSINTALLATDVTQFNSSALNTVYTALTVISNFVMVAIVSYYNNDFSEIAAIKTGEMRQEKARQKKDYVGETMSTDGGDHIE